MRVAALVVALALTLGACTNEEGDGRPRSSAEALPQPKFTAPRVEPVTEPAGSWLEASCELEPEIITRVLRGWQQGRSPDVLVVPRFPNFFGGFIQTGHSGPWDYLQEVPLVFYGPGFIKPLGRFDAGREVTVADIAPTVAGLLGVEAPASDGKALDILVPEEKRTERPKLILQVVWDGGGTNVLETWPALWPDLAKLERKGASPRGSTVGSSPSVTPSTHTTMGTGVFPARHGIASIMLRTEEGQITDAFKGKDAEFVEAPMLADTYDLSTGNAAKVGLFAYKNWHLGMMSHGSEFPGGDKDIAVFLDTAEKYETSPTYYEGVAGLENVPGLQRAVREIDLLDGKSDDKWMGHDVLSSKRYRRDTAVWAIHQTDVIKELIKKEGFGADEIPDLLYTNYKQPDEAGHNWNMLSPEVGEIVKYTDAQLGELVGFLNDYVGKKRWVMIVTADHGQQPDAEKTRGWPIYMSELTRDIAAGFGVEEKTLVYGSAGGMWMRRKGMDAAGITLEDVAEFLVNYRIEDNIPAGKESEIPPQYESRMQEPIFAAAFPGVDGERVQECAASRA